MTIDDVGWDDARHVAEARGHMPEPEEDIPMTTDTIEQIAERAAGRFRSDLDLYFKSLTRTEPGTLPCPDLAPIIQSACEEARQYADGDIRRLKGEVDRLEAELEEVEFALSHSHG